MPTSSPASVGSGPGAKQLLVAGDQQPPDQVSPDESRGASQEDLHLIALFPGRAARSNRAAQCTAACGSDWPSMSDAIRSAEEHLRQVIDALGFGAAVEALPDPVSEAVTPGVVLWKAASWRFSAKRTSFWCPGPRPANPRAPRALSEVVVEHQGLHGPDGEKKRQPAEVKRCRGTVHGPVMVRAENGHVFRGVLTAAGEPDQVVLLGQVNPIATARVRAAHP